MNRQKMFNIFKDQFFKQEKSHCKSMIIYIVQIMKYDII